MHTLLFYHDEDADGLVSGFILLKHFLKTSSVATIGYNYNRGFNPDIDLSEELKSDFDHIVMTDMHLPIETLKDLLKHSSEPKSCKITLIDHHRYTRTYLKSLMAMNAEIHHYTDRSAAMIAWQYVHPYDFAPNGVQLVSQYDSWNHDYPFDWEDGVLPFKYFLDTHLIFHHHDLDLLELGTNHHVITRYVITNDVHDSIEQGKLILQHYDQLLTTTGNFYIYDAVLRLPSEDGDVKEYTCKACNTTLTGSRLYQITLGHVNGLMVTYHYDPKIEQWIYHLYSDTEDVSGIARTMDGGGHKGAARFRHKNLLVHKNGKENLSSR